MPEPGREEVIIGVAQPEALVPADNFCLGDRISLCIYVSARNPDRRVSMGGHATAPSAGQDRNSAALNRFWEFVVHLGCTVKSVLVILSRIPHWKVRIIQPVP